MGAGSSSMLVRSLRRSLYCRRGARGLGLCAVVCAPCAPRNKTSRGTRAEGTRAPRAGGASSTTNVVNPLGTPLENPPDVIEAHERYYSRDIVRSVPYSYFSPSLLPVVQDDVVVVTRKDTVVGEVQKVAVKATPDRKLPTQHQHPCQLTTATRAPPKPERASLGAALRASSASGVRDRFASTAHCGHSKRHRSHANNGHHGHSKSSRTSRTSTSRTPTSRPARDPPSRTARGKSCFGYDIQDVDGFLAKASLASPANIPMVLACASTLYRTREGWQEEVSLPLGMVVNGVFRVSCWLYAQTPHGHEGYVHYTSCMPLGILPAVPDPAAPPSRPPPCWDTASDVFPALSGNRTDTDKLRDTRDTRSERAYRSRPSSSTRRGRNLHEAKRAEETVDALYLRASETTLTFSGDARILSWRHHEVLDAKARRPLVVVQRKFQFRSAGPRGFGHDDGLGDLEPGDVIAVLDAPSPGWLQVRDKHGRQGLVPADIADSGIL